MRIYVKVALVAAFSIVILHTIYNLHMKQQSKTSIVENRTVSHDLAKAKSDLTTKIVTLTSTDKAHYAVYIDFLDGEEPIVYHWQQMRSASMIKVFILAAALEEENKGLINGKQKVILKEAMKVGGAGVLNGAKEGTPFSVNQLLELMITESDNTATNIIIDLIGMNKINQYIQKEGYHDTVLQRKMMDFTAVKNGLENYTTVKDLGNFFKKVYYHKCINNTYDDMILDILSKQTDTECFPAALPKYKIAHKTGELDGLYDDGGIVYATGADYIICIMNDGIENRVTTMNIMKEIAIAANEVVLKK